MPCKFYNTVVCLAAFAAFIAKASGQGLDVSFARTVSTHTDQTISVTGGSSVAADLRPFVAGSITGFGYRYNLLSGLVSGPRIALIYDETDLSSSTPARRWRIVLETEIGTNEAEIDLLALEAEAEPDTLILQTKRYRAQQIKVNGIAHLQSAPDTQRRQWTFTTSDPVRPIVQSGASKVSMKWYSNGRLAQMTFAKQSLNFTYKDQYLQGINLAGPVTAHWDFDYRPAASGSQLVSIKRVTGNDDATTLNFTYDIESSANLASSSSMWLEVRDDPKFRLPSRANLRSEPGVRFSDVNADGFVDVILGDARRDPESAFGGREGWQFGSPFTVPTDFVRGAVPLGAQFINLTKGYKEKLKLTEDFPAVVVAGYKAVAANPRILSFDNRVCFPPVFNGRLRDIATDPAAWDCDPHPGLALPVPLQFTGTKEWPQHIPGMQSVERIGNQGARFVGFKLPLARSTLMYIGLRYRDAKTGLPIATGPDEAAFRDTGNCSEHRRLNFEAHGLRREVIEDVCQAFWIAAERIWSNAFKEKYTCQSCFWLRIDTTKGTPNGQFTLPWPTDPRYLTHYANFRNVSFPNLAWDNIHTGVKGLALVMGRGRSGGSSASIPDARELYVLERVNRRYAWRQLPRNSEFYPPEDFFRHFNGRFVDLDADGHDDAVVASGGRSVVYLNRLGTEARAWVEAPAFEIPRRCHFDTGACQFVDLDNDRDLDLIQETGRRVFLNQTSDGKSSASGFLRSFTNAAGNIQFVHDLQP